MRPLNVATLNVCLGLFNKLEYIKQCIEEFDIDILFVQECEISQMSNYDIYKMKEEIEKKN